MNRYGVPDEGLLFLKKTIELGIERPTISLLAPTIRTGALLLTRLRLLTGLMTCSTIFLMSLSDRTVEVSWLARPCWFEAGQNLRTPAANKDVSRSADRPVPSNL